MSASDDAPGGYVPSRPHGSDDSARTRRFDAMYREWIDPWNFRTSDYEREKYGATLAALPRARYHQALEIGCSIGELTRLLRERSDEVLGVDVSTIAIEEARRVHADVPGLRFEVGEAPRDWPRGPRDLVVLSEMLYFLTPAEIGTLAARIAATLEPGGHCIAVCWLGETDADVDLGGDEAAEHFAAALCGADGADVSVLVEASVREPHYRLDVFERADR